MSRNFNVVVLGGGTGQATILRGIKNCDNIDLTAIVTVADDGGSTGRLRRSFHIPAMGDIRNVMIAMAESESLLSTLMSYRFEKEEGVAAEDDELTGHNLGNLILTALTQSCGNFMEAIGTISKVLNVKGDIVPSTSQIITLFAEMEDGTIVRGESNIPKVRNRIKRVFYQEEVHATAQAIEAIREADIIIYGIGSIYTSILPNIIIDEIRNELQISRAFKIYFCNAMTQPGETDGFSMEDHIEAIVDHVHDKIDLVVYAEDRLPQEVLDRYVQLESVPVMIKNELHDYIVIKTQLLEFGNGLIRHDSARIKEVMEDIMTQLEEN